VVLMFAFSNKVLCSLLAPPNLPVHLIRQPVWRGCKHWNYCYAIISLYQMWFQQCFFVSYFSCCKS